MPFNITKKEIYVNQKRVFPVLTVLALLLLFAGCENNSVNTEVPDDELPTDVSFSGDIMPILNNSCGDGTCHITSSSNGVNLSSYQNVMNSTGASYNKKIVIPNEPGNSPIVDKLEPNPEFGSRMPLSQSPLSTEKINLIKGWINEGALNN